MTIEEMKRIKQEKGYSYAQLAQLSGVPQGTLQKIFTGETTRPRYETLLALERALNKAMEESAAKSPAAYARYRKEMTRVAETSFEYGTSPSLRQQGEYTVDDLANLPEEKRFELIDGYLFEMDAPSIFHQAISGEIYRQISNFIIDHDGDCVPFVSPIDVQLDQDDKTMLQPDVIIMCHRDRILAKNIFGAPDFALEVLSPSTRKKDSFIKMDKYRKANVQEYWIVDPKQKTIFVHDLAGETGTTIYPIDADVPVGLYNGELVINLSRMIQRLPENLQL